MTLSPDHQRILGVLTTQGLATSAELQRVTGKSQPSVSRLLADLTPAVLAIGRGRATRYALGKSIHGSPPQHMLWWTDEAGVRQSVGTLSFLANRAVHVDSPLFGPFTGTSLPWYLSTLKAEGFLGRLAARSMTALGVEDDPDKWPLETILHAALQVHDAPGALTVGFQDAVTPPIRLGGASLAESLDAAASGVATTLPAGSSAGGEQPKFLATDEDGAPAIVKFTPPLGSPGGQRWADLLHAEHLAGKILQSHGIAAASSRVVQTDERAYLISRRFDRPGGKGRRHVVAIGKAHEGFVQGTYRNWVESGAALTARGSLSPSDQATIQTIRDFGRLIGNTDMHSGNLALFVDLEGVRRGRFELAPVYDMLPMRWRPDAMQGGVGDYAAFLPDEATLASGAAPIAWKFWRELSQLSSVTKALRAVSREMSQRLER